MKFLFFQECFCTLLKFGIKVTGIFIFKIIKANDSPDLSVDMTCTPWSLQTQYWLPVVKVILDFLEEIWYIALFKCEPFQEKSHIILRPKQKLSANMASVKEIEWKKIKGWRFCSSDYNFLKDKGTSWKLHSQTRWWFTYKVRLTMLWFISVKRNIFKSCKQVAW